MRNQIWLILVFFAFSISGSVYGQQDKSKNAPSATSYDPKSGSSNELSYLPSTGSSSSSKKSSKKFQIFSSKENRKYKNSYAWQLDQKISEYEQRMKAVAKQDRKEAKLARKPQYSDPLYFGHKHKPKKRKPGKRKLCKECLMVH